MPARQRRSFDNAFAGVFGDMPRRLYGRFTAELTENAMTVARAGHWRDGELWQGTSRGSGEPAVSPDGRGLGMGRRHDKGESKVGGLPAGPNEGGGHGE